MGDSSAYSKALDAALLRLVGNTRDRGVEAVNARVLFDALHRADGHGPGEDLHVDLVLLPVYGIYA